MLTSYITATIFMLLSKLGQGIAKENNNKKWADRFERYFFAFAMSAIFCPPFLALMNFLKGN